MSLDRYVWFKGKIIHATDAKVSALSPTALYGLNVFEGIRGYWDKDGERINLFRLSEHLNRLEASCRILHLNHQYSRDDIIDSIVQTVKANDYRDDIAIRVVVFIDGEGSWMSTDTADMMILPIKKSRNIFSHGDGLNGVISSWTRIDDNSFSPRIKAGANYINGRYAHLLSPTLSNSIPIFLDKFGNVAETPGACIMLIKNGVVYTPSITSSILDSITRNSILDICNHLNILFVSTQIQRTDLYLADEIFICGSSVEITPIISIDNLPINKPQCLTTFRLLSFLHSIFDGTDSKFSSWRYPI